ncbi:MAG: DNA polymerase/3'-5' exonuclease PolX [Candidatus Omnitrophica bacterium]|nr:DNA polymerase/3'-5' exonuclease PolX [Candidatus Omnitrophota bacterium]MBU1925122.1 DNA polymerase/3'-5' exonuclease PolX [Candidatus Omnitrophota bacterium]
MMNKEIADIFRQIADILEIKDENFFRVRAYRKAAQNIENLTEDLIVLVNEKRLDVPGVGVDLAGKIEELVTTGALKFFEELKKTIPPGLLEIMTIPGIGPKTTKLLFDKLKIDSVSKLEIAAREDKLSSLPGLKEKTQENILQGIELIKQRQGRILLSTALSVAQKILDALKKLKVVEEAVVAGSVRRRKETIHDIDILVTSTKPQTVTDVFTSLPIVKKILAKGDTKSSVIVEGDIQVDLRVVGPESFGAALNYLTGSKAHNIRIRELAKKKGLKINEYGVFREKTNRIVAGKTEHEVYKTVGLCYIEPELREDTGEIEAAADNALPQLVVLTDIKSDLHIHSRWSDGTLSIADMAKAAKAQGYKYMVVSDHSQSLKVAGGLTPKRLKEQIDEIKRLNRSFKDFRILCSAEVDIKSDGSLDFDDDILKELDVVLAAVHSGFKQAKEQLTGRITRAMQNKYVNIIVHPFGRLINERPAYELDFEKILQAACDTNTALEINCYPKRLDLDDIHVKRAKEKGAMLSLGTDSHAQEQLDFMELGVAVARRGWLEKKNLLNCLSSDEFLDKIRKK